MLTILRLRAKFGEWNCQTNSEVTSLGFDTKNGFLEPCSGFWPSWRVPSYVVFAQTWQVGDLPIMLFLVSIALYMQLFWLEANVDSDGDVCKIRYSRSQFKFCPWYLLLRKTHVIVSTGHGLSVHVACMYQLEIIWTQLGSQVYSVCCGTCCLYLCLVSCMRFVTQRWLSWAHPCGYVVLVYCPSPTIWTRRND